MKVKTLLPFLAAGMIVLISACMNFYKATPARSGSAAATHSSMDSLQKLNRYFILRNGDDALYIRNIELSADQQSAHCVLDYLPNEHKLHLVNGRNGKKSYKKNEVSDLAVLNEVHFYIPKDNTAVAGEYTLQLNNVTRIEVIEHDKKRTTNSYVLGAIGGTLGVAALAAIIIAVTKSSCPFVSAYHDNELLLQGEIYGGAIYPQLERHDYMPLKMSVKKDGSLEVMISNELKERQYTDMADLWIIAHDKNSRVLADEHGNLFSITDPRAPLAASFNEKEDTRDALLKPNDDHLLYFSDTTTADAMNEAILSFQKPATQQQGRLVLSLKNSYFLDYLYGELAKGLGASYASYVEQQKKKTATELLKWVNEQKIPLEVSVKTNSGWQKITSITTIGPLATREIVIPIDLSGVAGNITEIKLSSGFMFWEIDYAAMDYSSGKDFTVQKLSPVSAIDEKNNNVLAQIEKEDAIYLAQPETGNAATFTYMPSRLDEAKGHSFILHTKGYYEHVREFTGKPDIAFLQQFTKPGAFAGYGKELFKKVRANSLQMMAGKK